ncbi:MAG: hypothetical protein SGCHY_005415 [Lobulomycetales sp.]
MTRFKNVLKGRTERTRISVASGNYIPIPERPDPFKDQKPGPLDTPADIVKKVTWNPDINECPFPTPLMNQLYRLKRIGQEGKGI